MMVTVEDPAHIAAFSNFTLSDSSSSPAPPAASAAPTTPAAPVPLPTQASTASSSVTQTTVSSGNRVVASPLAKKLARDSNLDISRLAGMGSGPNGRIIAADIQAAPSRLANIAASTSAASPASSISATSTTTPVSSSSTIGGFTFGFVDFETSADSQRIAARLTHAKQVFL
jgi:pyruvate dehydrogenase E2 component (dihydrolipoamide acetyltransferase)